MVKNGYDLCVTFLTCCTAHEKMKNKKTAFFQQFWEENVNKES